MNENTTELVVTAPLDREEVERYRLLLVCRVRTETRITRVETSLDVLVNDEDDNSPFVNGTDTADVVISLNRAKVRGHVSANRASSPRHDMIEFGRIKRLIVTALYM